VASFGSDLHHVLLHPQNPQKILSPPQLSHPLGLHGGLVIPYPLPRCGPTCQRACGAQVGVRLLCTRASSQWCIASRHHPLACNRNSLTQCTQAHHSGVTMLQEILGLRGRAGLGRVQEKDTHVQQHSLLLPKACLDQGLPRRPHMPTLAATSPQAPGWCCAAASSPATPS